MGLARALTFGGAVALAVASVSPWFSYDPPDCGWTCYSPTHIQTPESYTRFGPATAWSGLGLWVALALGALLLVAIVALVRSGRAPTRRVPAALAVVASACAAAVTVRTATQPAILPGGRAGDSYVFVEAAAYVGVGAALLTAIGVALLARRGRLESPVA